MMEIEIIVGTDGQATVHVASILYDLWEDYLFFRKEVQNQTQADPLYRKRLTRASINAFFSYFDGVLNQWIAQIDPSFKIEGASFGSKIAVVRRRIKGGKLPWLDLEKSRMIRNKICHMKLTDSDLDIVEELLAGKFFSDADHLTNWLRIASKRLGMECHPNVPMILSTYSNPLGISKDSDS
jgi:hypothetical protein